MAQRFNPLDPLGLLEPIKRDIDKAAQEMRLEGRGRLLDPLGLFGQGRGPGHSGKRTTIGNPIPAEFDGRLEDLKGQARRRLIERGYPETLVDRALTWHDEWLIGMARRLAPGDPELQRRVVQSAYAEIAPRAERWLRGIQEAFGVAVPG